MNIVIPAFTHDGGTVINATPADLIQAGFSEAAVLDAVKPLLMAQVDASAETARIALITPGVGQAMEYIETQAQAEAALASTTEPKVEDYPMLAASIGIDTDPDTGKPAKTVKSVAKAVMLSKNRWSAAGAGIRKARLTTKAAIASATTFEQAAAAVAGAQWPS